MEPAFLNTPSGFFDRALPLLFPSQCLECGARVGRLALGGMCAPCWSAQSWLPAASRIGGARGFKLASTRAAAFFEGGLREAIHAWKFQKRLSFLNPFASILAEACAGIEVDAACWIPASKASLKERGFDQAGELAAGAAGLLGLPLLKGPGLWRARQGEPQRNLSREERLENAKGAFSAALPPALAGAELLLIDDVMTTGATLGDGARALIAAGAGAVHGAVLARGRG